MVLTVLYITSTVAETVVYTANCIGFGILETGGPYCPVYSFLCQGNSGSKFLYIAISVYSYLCPVTGAILSRI